MKHPRLSLAMIVAALGLALTFQPAQADPPPQQVPQPPQQQNQRGKPPASEEAVPGEKAGIKLERLDHKTDNGMKVWKIRIPGGRPLATPAYANGRLYLGGGFGSHEFYAIEADSGRLHWLYHTGDDGPTAAVCQDGFIAFNTESCELEVLTPRGRRVWKKWLGDPLMSMPAMGARRVYMAYPDSRGDRHHHVACFDVESGKKIWDHQIDGEIITTPVLKDGKVYLTTLAGLLYCFDAGSGKMLWSENKKATSSPAVIGSQCYYSQRSETEKQAGGKVVRQQNEHIVSRGTTATAVPQAIPGTASEADYLDYQKKAGGNAERARQSQDASVGFSTSKGDAKIHQANSNLGENSVVGVWSYQGSRPFAYKGNLYSSMGDTLKSVDPISGKVNWKKTLRKAGDKEHFERTLTPPVLVNGKVFVATTYGVLECLDAKTGKDRWSVNLGEAIAFQPIVAKGRVYVPGAKGTLFCVETGDPSDDGWYMWGANASHDGKPSSPEK